MKVRGTIDLDVANATLADIQIALPDTSNKTWRLDSLIVSLGGPGSEAFGSVSVGVSNQRLDFGGAIPGLMANSAVLSLAALSISSSALAGLLLNRAMSWATPMIDEVYLLNSFFVSVASGSTQGATGILTIAYIMELSEVKTTSNTQAVIQDSLLTQTGQEVIDG